jgi:hypothetical protein
VKLARESLPSIPASVYTLALVLASCGGAAIVLCGAWIVTNEPGAAELGRALIYVGLLLAVAAACVATQPWGPR